MKIEKIIKKINNLSLFQQAQLALFVSDIAFTINEHLFEDRDVFFRGDNPCLALKTGKASLFEKERKLSLFACYYLDTSMQYNKIIQDNKACMMTDINRRFYVLAVIHNATFIATHLALTPIGHPHRYSTKLNINEKEMRNCIKYSIKSGVKKKAIINIISNFN